MSTPDTSLLFNSTDALKLESGQVLPAFTVAYETFGTLNSKKDNAIMVCHALSGDAHVCRGSRIPGWWDKLIGPGKPIDTKTYFVICTNALGSCYGSTGPTSINPETKKPYNLSFPVITIADMVNAQHALIKHLDITHLHAVIGGSMGGMQALEWGIMYPDIVKNCILIATAASLPPQSLAFNAVGREAIISDPKFKDGNYTKKTMPKLGLSTARMVGHITYRSNESMSTKFGRKLQERPDYGYDFSTDFQVESYLKHQGDKFVDRFDPNSYIYLAKAMSYFDIPKKYGSLNKAFKKCKSRFLVASITSDWLYPPSESKRLVKALMKLNKPVTYSEIESPHGHDAFLMDTPPLHDLVSAFMENS